MTTEETIDQAVRDAESASESEAQTAMDGTGFETPVKSRVELAELWLEQAQEEVEAKAKALGNAKSKLRYAVGIRDAAEENLRQARAEKAGDGSDEPEDESEHVVIAVYPGDGANTGHPTTIGKHTQYSELICDYLTSIDSDDDPDNWRVVAERAMTDPELDYGYREHDDMIDASDYGQRLRVVAAD